MKLSMNYRVLLKKQAVRVVARTLSVPIKDTSKFSNSTQSARSQKISHVFQDIIPKTILPDQGTYGDLGEEISGSKLSRTDIVSKLNSFFLDPSIRELAKSHQIEDKLFTKAFVSFRKYCYKSLSLPPELHIKFCDIIHGFGHITDLYPFFLSHAREAFPHLECQEELKKISYLGLPHNWYPIARQKSRKIYFHCGPTNSGKTYHAMKRFLASKSGIYCSPLKMLAHEIFNKSNANNTPCDLVTGEDRRMANEDGTKSSHIACTVEMVPLNEPVEVALIDEIQMIRDPGRGWAWTRALLGIPADEIHLCGEEAALDIVKKMLIPISDTIEVHKYSRLTPLVIEDKHLESLKEIRDSDCIVCFSKDQLYNLSMNLENLGYDVSVIYGTLPPDVKDTQSKKFNQKSKNPKVMVATDAIGMGLNLSIGRIIFASLMKMTSDETGSKSMEYLSTSQALQIAGRAGRYKTAFETGFVTTLKAEDLRTLREILSRPVLPIERAGLHPTADQIELFAYHLPHLTLNNLIELFVDLCEYDSSAYFMCDLENFKLLAASIDHIQVPLRARYIFCCSPINTNFPFALTMFTKFVRQYSSGEPVTADWLKRQISWPCKPITKLNDLVYYEQLYDSFELYLWLSYRFVDMFPEPDGIREMQKDLSGIIFDGVIKITNLISESDAKRNKIPWQSRETS